MMTLRDSYEKSGTRKASELQFFEKYPESQIMKISVSLVTKPWAVLVPRYNPPFYCKPLEDFPSDVQKYVDVATEQVCEAKDQGSDVLPECGGVETDLEKSSSERRHKQQWKVLETVSRRIPFESEWKDWDGRKREPSQVRSQSQMLLRSLVRRTSNHVPSSRGQPEEHSKRMASGELFKRRTSYFDSQNDRSVGFRCSCKYPIHHWPQEILLCRCSQCDVSTVPSSPPTRGSLRMTPARHTFLRKLLKTKMTQTTRGPSMTSGQFLCGNEGFCRQSLDIRGFRLVQYEELFLHGKQTSFSGRRLSTGCEFMKRKSPNYCLMLLRNHNFYFLNKNRFPKVLSIDYGRNVWHSVCASCQDPLPN